GKRFNEIISAGSVQRIVRTTSSDNFTAASASAQEFYDALFANLFASNEKAGACAIGANEAVSADQFAILASGEKLFQIRFAHILFQDIRAVLIRGPEGQCARIPIIALRLPNPKP